MPEAEFCLFITPIGAPESNIRRRAEDIQRYIIEPVVRPLGMGVQRGDQFPEPGMITTQVIQAIMRCRVIVADLTGANANVYYELGVAQTLGRPVVLLVDKVRNLAFDVAHERVIALGDDGVVSLAQGKRVEGDLSAFVHSVIDGTYQPRSVVSDAASLAAVGDLASDEPLAAVLSQIRADVTEIHHFVQRYDGASPATISSDVALLRRFAQRVVSEYGVDRTRFRNELMDGRTTDEHDKWVEDVSGQT